MGLLTTPDFSQQLMPYEGSPLGASVRSTALAYRFMVRRSLGPVGGAHGGAQPRAASLQPDEISRAAAPGLSAHRALHKRAPT